MDEGIYISIREFSRRVGVSDTAVNKAIKAGKISEDCLDRSNIKRPKINPIAALKSWGKNYAPGWKQSNKLNESIEAHAEIKEQPVEKKPETVKQKKNLSIRGNELDVPADDQLEDPDENDTIWIRKSATFAEAKRVEAIAIAKLAQVKLNEQKGKLISKDKVYKEFFDVGIRVRTSLQGIPDKWIDNLLACSTRSEAHSMLYEAITESLEELVKTGEV